MKSITISRELAEKLLSVPGEVIDLVNEKGEILGLFRRNQVLPPPYDLDDAPEQSEEEFQRDVAEGPLLTTDEVFQNLRSAE